MLASDVWIEKLAVLSHEDEIYSVDPLSSEDVAVVVDFHWFTDCHLEAIFNMNDEHVTTSAPIYDHRRRERCSSDHRCFSLNPAQRDILPHRQSQLSDLTNDFFEVYITETVTLSPNIQMWCYHQFNFYYPFPRDQSFFFLIGQNRLQLMFRYDNSQVCKYSDISCWTAVKSVMDDHWQ